MFPSRGVARPRRRLPAPPFSERLALSLLPLLADIVAVMAPVFLIAALGYAWSRAGLPFDGAFVTTFMINVATPCLVFSTLSRMRFAGGELLTMVLAALGCIALAALAAVPLLLAARLSLRVYLPALSFPNAGNMGVPLCLFAFGETGLGLAVLFFATLSIAQFTLGPAMAAGRVDPGQMLRTPVAHAVWLALLLRGLGLGVPAWAANTTSLLGGCAVPLMLMSLGITLSRLRLGGIGRAGALSTCRLGLGFGVGLLVTRLMGLEGTMRGVVLLQSTMPVAVFNYLWAVRYGNAPEEVAGMVLGSTVLSFLTLPLLLAAVT
jgi:predicted permease